MSDFVLALTTLPADFDAATLAQDLVGSGLAACVTIVPGIKSVYTWKGVPHIDQEQQLHDVISGRVRRLYDEDVVAANVLVDAYRNFPVRESPQIHTTEIDAEMAGDLFGEYAIGGAGQQLEAVARYC